MRTTAELRRAHNIPIPHNKDSVYKPIERKVRKFNPIEIPAKLQHLLPFKSKPKDRPKHKNTLVENRLRLLKHEKAKKKKMQDEKKKKAYEAEKAKTEQLTKKRQRDERRVRYRSEDKQKKRARG
ncbi:hypothetical protein GUJ93_ZPchr0003g17489 [Zizania palustris]|uniref:Uncharacterized protein n=1 Tax=Zizania palustris TaxID=103762 RepID=A0A8J5RV70_ZIZPA|nr:hypothetical protein GUJ93_ZPchr0003g17489 [Zizania palustris]